MLPRVLVRWGAGEKLQVLSGPWLMLGVFASVQHEALLLPVLLYGSKTIIWREKEMSRIRDG